MISYIPYTISNLQYKISDIYTNTIYLICLNKSDMLFIKLYVRYLICQDIICHIRYMSMKISNIT